MMRSIITGMRSDDMPPNAVRGRYLGRGALMTHSLHNFEMRRTNQ